MQVFRSQNTILLIALMCVVGLTMLGCDSGSRSGAPAAVAGSGSSGGGSTGSGSTGGGSTGGGSTGGGGQATGGTPGSTNVNLTVAGNLQTARGLFQAVVLDNGKVFVHQGLTSNQGQQSLAIDGEVYDPQADTWESTSQIAGAAGLPTDPNNQYVNNGTPGPAPCWAMDYSMTKLPNGKVLIAGGYGFNSFDNTQNPPTPNWEDLDIAHLFDPTTGSYELVPSKMNVARSMHKAVLLPNGKVLIAGGFSNATGSSVKKVEVYDPQTNAFLPANQVPGPLAEGRVFGEMFATPGGAIATSLAHLGPNPQNQSQTTLLLNNTPAEEFGVQSNLWNSAPNPNDPRIWAGGVTMANGNYIMGGGFTVNQNTGNQGPTTSIEVYETSSSGFAAFGNLQTARLNAMAAEFGNSSDVLFVGGMEQTQSGQQTSANALDSVEMWSATQNDVIATFQMQSDRSGGAAVTLNDGRIMIIGGFSGGGAQDPQNGSDGTPLASCSILSR